MESHKLTESPISNDDDQSFVCVTAEDCQENEVETLPNVPIQTENSAEELKARILELEQKNVDLEQKLNDQIRERKEEYRSQIQLLDQSRQTIEDFKKKNSAHQEKQSQEKKALLVKLQVEMNLRRELQKENDDSRIKLEKNGLCIFELKERNDDLQKKLNGLSLSLRHTQELLTEMQEDVNIFQQLYATNCDKLAVIENRNQELEDKVEHLKSQLLDERTKSLNLEQLANDSEESCMALRLETQNLLANYAAEQQEDLLRTRELEKLKQRLTELNARVEKTILTDQDSVLTPSLMTTGIASHPANLRTQFNQERPMTESNPVSHKETSRRNTITSHQRNQFQTHKSQYADVSYRQHGWFGPTRNVVKSRNELHHKLAHHQHQPGSRSSRQGR